MDHLPEWVRVYLVVCGIVMPFALAGMAYMLWVVARMAGLVAHAVDLFDEKGQA